MARNQTTSQETTTNISQEIQTDPAAPIAPKRNRSPVARKLVSFDDELPTRGSGSDEVAEVDPEASAEAALESSAHNAEVKNEATELSARAETSDADDSDESVDESEPRTGLRAPSGKGFDGFLKALADGTDVAPSIRLIRERPVSSALVFMSVLWKAKGFTRIVVLVAGVATFALSRLNGETEAAAAV